MSKIKEWLSKQETEQIMKTYRKTSSGHIVAYKPNEFWKIDTYDLSTYDKYNKGYKYIFYKYILKYYYLIKQAYRYNSRL